MFNWTERMMELEAEHKAVMNELENKRLQLISQHIANMEAIDAWGKRMLEESYKRHVERMTEYAKLTAEIDALNAKLKAKGINL